MNITDAIVYLHSDRQSLTIFKWDWGGGCLANFLRSVILLSFQHCEHQVAYWVSHLYLQVSCGDICQIWMWLEEYNRKFFKITYFAYGETEL